MPSEPRHIFTKVVGVTYRNPDGTSRQEIIASCAVGERLTLVHDGQNQYDPNAVEVRRSTGEQLGFLGSRLAEDVADDLSSGYRFDSSITALTGGGAGESRGCNMLIVIGPPGITDDDLKAYSDQIDRTDTDARPGPIEISISATVRQRDSAPPAPAPPQSLAKSGCLGTLIGIVVLFVVLYLLFAAPALAQDRTRVDLYDEQSRRTGYAIVDRESGRVDYYDHGSRHTGYGKVDDTGRAERFDMQGRRQPATVLPPVRGGQK